MAGPERILDVLQKKLETDAKIQQEMGNALLKAQTQRQLSEQLTQLGIKRAMGEAEAEAQDAAPEQQQAQPFRLQGLNAISEQRIAFQKPLDQVQPGQFSQSIAELGPNAGVNTALRETGQVPSGPGVPNAAQGLPIAGDEIVTRQTEVGVDPQRVGQQGFILTPSARERTTRTPNALDAGDIAQLRQRQTEFEADQARLAQVEKRARAGAFIQSFQGLASEGVPAGKARAVAEAVAVGDTARAAEAAKDLPKALSARVKESAIRENEMQARLAQARMFSELSKGGESRTRLDLLAGFQNFAGEEPPSIEQMRISLTQGLDNENKVLLRDAQIGNLARGQAVFLEPKGLKLWGFSADPRGLDAYEVIGRIQQFQAGDEKAAEALEELGFQVVQTPQGDELLPPEGLDEDLGRGLIRITRGQQIAQQHGKTLGEVAPAPQDPGEGPAEAKGGGSRVDLSRDLGEIKRTLGLVGGAAGRGVQALDEKLKGLLGLGNAIR